MRTEEENPNWSKYESFVSELGKWAWIIVLISGVIYVFWGIWILAWGGIRGLWGLGGLWLLGRAEGVWYLIGAGLSVALAIIVIKPRFSNKCTDKDWDSLLNDVLVLGSIRIPWMLIWGIIITVVGQWWAGLTILIPAFFLIFAGPKPYNWKVE